MDADLQEPDGAAEYLPLVRRLLHKREMLQLKPDILLQDYELRFICLINAEIHAHQVEQERKRQQQQAETRPSRSSRS